MIKLSVCTQRLQESYFNFVFLGGHLTLLRLVVLSCRQLGLPLIHLLGLCQLVLHTVGRRDDNSEFFNKIAQQKVDGPTFLQSK